MLIVCVGLDDQTCCTDASSLPASFVVAVTNVTGG